MSPEAVRRALAAAEVFIQRANAVLQDAESIVYVSAESQQPDPAGHQDGRRCGSVRRSPPDVDGAHPQPGRDASSRGAQDG